MAIKRHGGNDVRLSVRDRLSYGLARLCAWSGLASWRRYVLVAVPVDRMPAMPRGWEARIMEEAAPAGIVEPEVAEYRLRQGMCCIAAAPEGEVAVGVTWATTGRFEEDEAHLTFVPPTGAAWDTGLYVEPRARGGRAFAALFAGTRGWAEARGLRWSMSRISDYNLASRRSHARMGAHEIGRVAVLTLGGYQLAFGGRPFLTRLDGARAVIELPLP